MPRKSSVGSTNLVIAVAGGATGEALGFELVPHLGVLEELGDLAVASAAGVGDGVRLRRSGAVIAVAVVASRRTQVALVQQGLAVDALPPLGIFVAGKRLLLIRIARHVLWVGMALRTGLGHLRVVDGRGGFVHRTNAVRLQIDGIAVRHDRGRKYRSPLSDRRSPSIACRDRWSSTRQADPCAATD